MSGFFYSLFSLHIPSRVWAIGFFFPFFIPFHLQAQLNGACNSAPCGAGMEVVDVSITTDDYGSETSWVLIDHTAGDTCEYGDFTGGYGCTDGGGGNLNSNQTYDWSFCFPEGNDIEFRIYDVIGDGICCSWGNGSYTVEKCGAVVASGGDFGDCETTSFQMCESAVVDTCDSNNDCGSACAVSLSGDTCTYGDNSGFSDNWSGTVGCQSADGHPEAWFSFVPDSNYVDITVDSTDFTGDAEVTLVQGSCGGTLNEVDSACGPTSLSMQSSVNPGDQYYFTVSASDGSTGGFDMCLSESETSCIANDDCGSADSLELTTDTETCINDCNIGASVGPSVNGDSCEMSDQATVWYELAIPTDATMLNVSVSSSDLDNPHFMLLDGGCGSVYSNSCTEGSGGSAQLDSHVVNSGGTYYLAVSDSSGAEGDFEVCVEPLSDVSECLTDYTWTADTSGSLGPNTTVEFCFSIDQFRMTSSLQYLHGIVPTYGGGWDPASFTVVKDPTCSSCANWGGGCGDCELAGCTGCEGWNWYGPNTVDVNVDTKGYTNGDLIDWGGWWFTSDNGNVSCGNHNCDPNESWGDGCYDWTNQGGGSCLGDEEGAGLTWEVCFQLTTVDSADCDPAGDLSVGMMTFADGQTGSYTDPGCNPDNEVVWNNASPTCTALPVELLSFDGEGTPEGNRLKWKTATETRCSHYILERSSDGEQFEAMERVKGNGTTSELSSYQAFDPSPYPGVTYYRLKQVDLDGRSTRYGPVAIQSEGTGFELQGVQPNPSDGKFTLELHTGSNGIVEMQVFDRTGRKVHEGEQRVEKGVNSLRLDLSHLASGFYTLRLEQDGRKEQRVVESIALQKRK